MSVGTPEGGANGQLPVRWRRNADNLTPRPSGIREWSHDIHYGWDCKLATHRADMPHGGMH